MQSGGVSVPGEPPGLARHRHIVQAAVLADECALSLLVAMPLAEVLPLATTGFWMQREICELRSSTLYMWSGCAGSFGQCALVSAEPRYPPTRRMSFSSGVTLVGSRRRLRRRSFRWTSDQVNCSATCRRWQGFPTWKPLLWLWNRRIYWSSLAARRCASWDPRLGGLGLAHPPDLQTRHVPAPQQLPCAMVPPDTKAELTLDLHAGVPGKIAEADGAAGPPAPHAGWSRLPRRHLGGFLPSRR